MFLARDTRLDRDVAVAVVKTEGLDEDGLARVRREAQAMARLGDHPHIVTVYDIGEEKDAEGRPQPYIVSQYMAGGELGDMLRAAEGQRLPVAEAVRIANQVRMALEYAHERGIIHRDLKPANIWLTEDPSTGSGRAVAKLGDFGLAVALDRSRLTMEGMMVGTVAYMPPEQALGRQPDARSDLYSLGCVLYEMLTGRPPFLGDDSVAIISQHINTAPVAPTWHNPEIPKALESLIMRLLAKSPEERPENAAAIPEALAAINQSAAGQKISEEAAANPLDRLAGGVFVGRDAEMDELRAGLEDALSGRGRLLMLVGEPGIGKTRTSEELATYAGLRNVQVVWGRCYEGEGAPAYWPWVQAIRSYVHEQEPNVLMSQMGPGAADIAQVVSDVRERLPGLPEPPTLEPEQARFRLFDSITNFLKNASREKPMVLVLDDLHWADKPSLLLLQFLARELRGSRLMVLGTYRDVELRRAHPLSQTLGELGREGLSHRILLRGLTEQDVARFVEITSGREPPKALVEAVYRETEGNPFFVNEIVRLLVADGRLEKADEVSSWSVTIPQGVREVVGRRLDHLSEACNRVLTVGAVIGREFGLKTVEQALASSEEGRMTGDRLLEVLEEAVGARVIMEVPNQIDQYSFSHALIRETLYEELSTARRVRLHRQIGEVLEGDVEGHLPQLAYHFAEAAQGGDVAKAIDYAMRAGERALSQLAYEEAAGHYERALQVLDLRESPDMAQQCNILLTLGDARWKSGDQESSQEAYGKAAGMARELGDSERLGEAALGYANRLEVGTVLDDVVKLIDEALDTIGEKDSPLRAKLMARRGTSVYFRSQDELKEYADAAVAIARRTGDKEAIARALFSQVFGVIRLGTVDDRLDIAREIVSLGEEMGDTEQIINGLFVEAVASATWADMDGANRAIERFADLAAELRIPRWVWQAALFRAMQALFTGRIEDAERLVQEAFAVGQTTEPDNATQMFSVQLFAIRREQGRLAEMVDATRAFVERYPAVPAWRCGLAFQYGELGRLDEAREQLEIVAKDGFSSIPNDGNWPIAMALAADTACELGDMERAAELYRLLAPVADYCVIIGQFVDNYGPVHRFCGRLATALERWEEAERHFEASIETNERMGSPRWVAWSKLWYARMCLARGKKGDREKAVELATAAIEIAQERGMKTVVDRGLELKLKLQGIDSSDLSGSIDAVASTVYREKPDLRARAAPDGTVTLLFSDIEGSTAKTEELGDQRWMEVLREHNAIVREEVATHGGFEVKSEGDGFMLAFQSARKALQCAIAMQKAFEARNNGGAELPVRVRIGLHTGEVIKEGDDFFGKHVNLAARIASQATGGEILVSSLLKELTASGGDIAFDEGREVELKGLAGTQLVYGVNWRPGPSMEHPEEGSSPPLSPV